MAVQRMDNVGIVVDDIETAIAFFKALGLELEGRAENEGPAVDGTVGMTGVRCTIAMLRVPDGGGRLELMKYHTPEAITPTPEAPPANTLGLHRVMFAVDDIEEAITRLRPHGAELLGELVQYGDTYRLCYLRGPAGILVALAEQIG